MKRIGQAGPFLKALVEQDQNAFQCTTRELDQTLGKKNPLFRAENSARWGVFKSFLVTKRPESVPENCQVTDKNFQEMADLKSQMDEVALKALTDELRRRCHTPIPQMKVDHRNYPWRAGSIPKHELGPTGQKEIDEIKQVINGALDGGVMAGVTIWSSVLQSATSDWHILSVIGRERRAGTCFYQLRNSWGRDCGVYDRPKICNPKDGSIWLSEDELLKAVGATTVIP